jgi:transposase
MRILEKKERRRAKRRRGRSEMEERRAVEWNASEASETIIVPSAYCTLIGEETSEDTDMFPSALQDLLSMEEGEDMLIDSEERAALQR